jgi:hypothetical protein
MSRLKAISTTSTIENDQERNNINLKYSQNSQNDYSIKVLCGTINDVFLVDEGTLITPQTPLAIIEGIHSY